MKLLILTGPPAVGKMTVGQCLAEITGLKLFFNHMSLELVNQFFPFGAPAFSRLDKQIRFSIFEEVAKSDLPGLIFTIVWAFELEEDRTYIEEILEIFNGAEIYFVELKASTEERLRRNRTEHRLAHKPSKRDLEWSESSLIKFDAMYRMNANEAERAHWNMLSIDNTHLSAEAVAEKIKEHFKL